MQLKALCEAIQMPEAMTAQVIAADQQLELDWAAIYQGLPKMMSDEAVHQFLISNQLIDPLGIRCLTAELNLALQAHAVYQQKHLSDELYLATMGFFSRTVKEGFQERGKTCFRTLTWGIRQIQCREFRLGTLEFERTAANAISIHIPGDSTLTPNERTRAYQTASAFFKEDQPQHFHCNSWLLSPKLPALLPAQSKIRSFQHDFTVNSWNPDLQDYRKWAFHDFQGPVAELPAETSLQKNMKKSLLAGGKIGVGQGDLAAFSAAD